MKKQFLSLSMVALLILCPSCFLFGQMLVKNSNNTAIMTITNAGNVGIGMGFTNPQRQLHTTGTIRFDNLGTGTTNTVLLTMDANNDVSKRPLSSIIGVGGSGTATQVAFWDGSAGAGSTTLSSDVELYWDKNGNRLGIGTSSPIASLDVAGSVRINLAAPEYDLFIYGGSSGAGDARNLALLGLTQVGATARDLLHINYNSEYAEGTTVNGALGVGLAVNIAPAARLHVADGNVRFQSSTAGRDLNWMNTNGRLGVGTSAPAATLHTVGEGTVRFDGLATGNTNTTVLTMDQNNYVQKRALSTLIGVGGSGVATRVAFWSGTPGSSSTTLASDANLYWNDSDARLGIGKTSPGASLDVQNNGTGWTGAIGYAAATLPRVWFAHNNNYGILVRPGSNAAHDDYALQVTDNAETGQFWVGGDGRVGIGTTNPQVKLHANGQVRFEGLGTGTTNTILLTLDENKNVEERSVASLIGVGGSGVATQVAFWSGTPGSSSTTLSSSANLFWETASGELGIGKTAPAATLDVVRNSAGWSGIFYYGEGGITRPTKVYMAHSDNLGINIDPGQSATSADYALRTADMNNVQSFWVGADGRVGIGNTNVSSLDGRLTVLGHDAATLPYGGSNNTSIFAFSDPGASSTDSHIAVEGVARAGSAFSTTSMNRTGVHGTLWNGSSSWITAAGLGYFNDANDHLAAVNAGVSGNASSYTTGVVAAGLFANSNDQSNHWGLYVDAPQNYYSGDVIIGSTAPRAKLTVVGSHPETDGNAYLTGINVIEGNIADSYNHWGITAETQVRNSSTTEHHRGSIAGYLATDPANTSNHVIANGVLGLYDKPNYSPDRIAAVHGNISSLNSPYVWNSKGLSSRRIAVWAANPNDNDLDYGMYSEAYRNYFSGKVAIGFTNPAISGSASNLIVNLASGTGTLYAVVMDASGNFYRGSSSSVRYKTNIQPLADPTYKILDASPVSFDYKESGNKSVGLIAEELDELGLKELVIYNNDGQADGVAYDKVSVYLLNVIKDLKKRVEELEAAR